MSQAHKRADAAEDGALLEESEQLGIVTLRIPKRQQARLWQAKILKGKKIQDLVCEALEKHLRGLNL